MKSSHFLFCAICVLLALSCQKEPEVVKVESVSLNSLSITIVEGESQSLTATVSPSNAGNKKVIWSSSNSSVATVDDRGTVTAIAPGTATITAKTEEGGKTATCSVTVNSKTIAVESISLDKTEATLAVGETITLIATISPDDATDKTVAWNSSDEAVATVKDGVVTAIKVGSATITAKAGDKTVTSAVTVTAEETTGPFTIKSVGYTTVAITKEGAPYDITLEYRKGAGSWSAYTIGSTIDLADGENVQFIAGEEGNANFSGPNWNHYRVVVSGSGTVKVSGNIMFLLDRTGERAIVPNYVFNHLFSDCNKLIDASKLELPATVLAESCYSYMFFGCTSLQTASNLPATKLAKECYCQMYDGCTSLQAAPELPATILAESCYSGMFYDCTSLQTAPELPATTLAESCYEEMFHTCRNLQAAPELPATTLAKECYAWMFDVCPSLHTTPKLPATTLAESCYLGMFRLCTSLQTAPDLPATNLAKECYNQMFDGCTSLQTAPELPATTLDESCYSLMFRRCTSLQTAPKLPATTLAESCYSGMFYDCTSLQTATELPATTLSSSCYSGMFGGCTSLQTAPKLPAANLVYGCYSDMFGGCTSLQAAPELPATILAMECYRRLFSDCTGLTQAPKLPATKSIERCYEAMFAGCTSLKTAPELSATTLAESCYSGMFSGCTSLQTAPELPATNLANYCYEEMFYGCSNLNYVEAMFETTPSDTYTENWLAGVSSTGTFVKSKNATWDVTGPNGIPEGWAIQIPGETNITLDKTEATLVVEETITLTATVSPADAIDKTVTWSSSDESIATVKEGVVTAIKVGSATITAKAGDKTATCVVIVNAEATTNPFTITSVGSTSVSIIRADFPNNITLEYRKGVGVWSAYTIGSTIDLADGENVHFIAGKGGNANFSGSNSNHYRVVVFGSGTVKVSGNIMSLLDKTGEITTMPNYVFNHLFSDCIKLVDASKLELPTATLATNCYDSMFYGCTSLKTAPEELPATKLASGCYSCMFYGCTSLQTAPELSATTLASNCYSGMFFGCTSLHAAPKLPATTLASNCYVNMFSGCTSLQAAPELPAIKLASGCYSCMFYGCASLQTAPELPATTLTESCYLSMFTSCTSLQTAPELPATNLDGSCYHAMFMRCSSLQAAPELPATNLAYGCYSYMFSGCTSLQAAPELPAAKLVYECYRSMFSECTSLHATPVLPATNLVERCYDEMFSSCSRLNYVEAMFETTPSDTYTGNWLTGVSSTGTFVKSKNATWNVTGPHGIPEGWTVQIAE